MNPTPEQLDQLVHRAKQNADLSDWRKSGVDSSSVNLVSVLSNIPKAHIEQPNLMRARNKILDRISLPGQSNTTQQGWLALLPRFARLAGGFVGGFIIMLGLTIGTAAVALESVPGQPIYPLKKLVETVQMQMASNEQERASLQIKFANNRVEELEAIIQKQREGRASEQQVKRAVEDAVRNIAQTSQSVTNQSQNNSQTEMLTKLVSLNDKQTAVIIAAQKDSEGPIKEELARALETSKITREQAIENMERAGLSVENTLVLINDSPKIDTVFAEGKLTVINGSLISIGTAQFLLTNETEYVNLNRGELKVGVNAKILGEVVNNRTIAKKIELVEPPVATPSPSPTQTETEKDNPESGD